MSNEKIRSISKTLFSILIISPLIVLLIIAPIGKDDLILDEGLYYMMKRAWVYFLFLPVALYSVKFGLDYRGRTVKTRRNILSGIVITIISILFASTSIIGLKKFSTDYSYVIKIESFINFDLPNEGSILVSNNIKNLQEPYDDKYYIENVLIKSESVIRFNDNETDFTKNIRESILWIKIEDFSQSMNDIITSSLRITTEEYNYFMLYSIESNEYNQIKTIQDKGDYIYLAYDSRKKILLVYEFQIKNVKE